MDPGQETAFFVAFSPAARLAFGYVWQRADFPWMGIWEENCQPVPAAVERRHADPRAWSSAPLPFRSRGVR